MAVDNGNGRRSFSRLQRFARQANEAAEATQEAAREHCELCSEPIPEEYWYGHRHLLEVSTREILCACQGCALLFDREVASEGRYRLVPDRHLYLEDFQISEPQWESLRIPVDMAFLFYNTPAERMVAFYPSPMGPTESLLDLSTWEELEEANPTLGDMERDVEALLVDRTRGTREHFLVPIDECYRLVGMIRMNWRGLSGGREVWDEIGKFFDELKSRSKTVKRGQS